MKINAYILAADPAWIEASVLSYYDLVGRIVVSYDSEGRGWTGTPIDVEQCLRRLKAIDTAGKLDFRPGHFARAEFFDRPIESDTYQRQAALNAAAEDRPDWVFQLDTDEVIGDRETFLRMLTSASEAGAEALAYPARNLWQRAGKDRFLEWALRGGALAAAFPGPVVVRPRVVLSTARRCETARHFFVHYGFDGFQGAMPNMDHVDAIVPPDASIWHLSWVRTDAAMRAKLSSWGHARDRDWTWPYRCWKWARGAPGSACWLSQRLPARLWPGPPLRMTRSVALSGLTERWE